MRSAYKEHIAVLEDAMVRCSEHRRALVLQQVTKHFLEDERETVRKLDYLDDVLVCLMNPASASDLASVSNALVRSGLELPRAIQQLAFHRDPSVAVPVLRHCSWVSCRSFVNPVRRREIRNYMKEADAALRSGFKSIAVREKVLRDAEKIIAAGPRLNFRIFKLDA